MARLRIRRLLTNAAIIKRGVTNIGQRIHSGIKSLRPTTTAKGKTSKGKSSKPK